jgi:diguanylate cyclase (GGDEF)-like protein
VPGSLAFLRMPARWLAAVAFALACSTPAALAGTIGEAVLAIEAQHGAEPPEVIARLQPLEAPARASGGDDLRIFLAAWGYAHAAIDKPTVADAAVEELSELGQRTRDPAALASAYALRACMLQFSGQVRAAYGWIAGAVPLAAQNASPDLHYWVYMTAGDLATSNGQLDEGIRMMEASVAAARASRNPRREAQAHLAVTPLRLVRGQIRAALRAAVLVRELGVQAGDRSLVVSGWVMESLAAEAAGQAERSAHAREAFAAWMQQLAREAPAAAVNSQAGSTTWFTSELDALLNLSSLHLVTRDHAAARRLALRAHKQAEAQNDEGHVARALINLGMAEIGAGRVQAGMRQAAEGLARMERQNRSAELLIQLNRYAAALERHGEPDEALRRLRESLVLENELARRDRQSTVVALQRQSSFQQRQRELEQLEHVNTLQAVQLARRTNERTLTLLLAAAMGLGGVVAWRLYLRARESNRRLALNNEELEFASTHDRITGLLNRRAMEADTAALSSGPYCGVTISVKQFGLIVGSVGHQLGDTLLCQIARRLDEATTRCGGRLYRVDGVIFGALFRFGNDDERLRKVLEALVSAMEPAFEIGNQDLIVSIGVGASEYPKDGSSAQEVARLAELAKLQAHAEPGNSFVVYDARIGESQRDKLHMEARMLKGLEHGEFELFYQGQRDLRDGTFCGFEALLRWHDGGRMVSPAQFIPLAEESGLIVRIGAWVLEQACLQARAWADSGVGRPKVAVNISPRQFNHPDFMAMVGDTLRRTGVEPAQIEIEITEGSVMNDAEASIAQLHALRALGLQLAIDDFGTGYASLSYLRRFPLNRLKIDRSFINQINASEQDDTIVRTVIELAHGLGLSVTAEGVETVAQENTLKRWGCDIVQGFLHSRPAPAATATRLLEAGRKGVAAAA